MDDALVGRIIDTTAEVYLTSPSNVRIFEADVLRGADLGNRGRTVRRRAQCVAIARRASQRVAERQRQDGARRPRSAAQIEFCPFKKVDRRSVRVCALNT